MPEITFAKQSTVLAGIMLAAACLAAPSSGQSVNAAEAARQSIVYIFFDVVDPGTGSKTTIQGTGFIVSPKGYVLTASHLFRTWRKQTPVDQLNNPIKATLRDKPGYVTESPLILSKINIGDPEQEDVALLKLPAPPAQDYPTAPICFHEAEAAKVGDPLTAYGFPHDQNFQPVPGVLGTQNAPGGRWAAASAFAEGMSGGPVYTGGTVIGLVKGGLDLNAVNWITPMSFADSFLRTAGFVEKCGSKNALAEPAHPGAGGAQTVEGSCNKAVKDVQGSTIIMSGDCKP